MSLPNLVTQVLRLLPPCARAACRLLLNHAVVKCGWETCSWRQPWMCSPVVASRRCRGIELTFFFMILMAAVALGTPWHNPCCTRRYEHLWRGHASYLTYCPAAMLVMTVELLRCLQLSPRGLKHCLDLNRGQTPHQFKTFRCQGRRWSAAAEGVF
jgi:hypothetical protein